VRRRQRQRRAIAKSHRTDQRGDSPIGSESILDTSQRLSETIRSDLDLRRRGLASLMLRDSAPIGSVPIGHVQIVEAQRKLVPIVHVRRGLVSIGPDLSERTVTVRSQRGRAGGVRVLADRVLLDQDLLAVAVPRGLEAKVVDPVVQARAALELSEGGVRVLLVQVVLAKALALAGMTNSPSHKVSQLTLLSRVLLPMFCVTNS
jgi:hypothetical protein